MSLLLSIAMLLRSANIAPSGHDVAAGWCQDLTTTGYVRTEHGTHTFDGTPIWTDEAIAAASWDIPMGWYAVSPELGTFRIADRGSGLGNQGWVDVAVWSRSEAFAITGVRRGCVYPPGEVPQ